MIIIKRSYVIIVFYLLLALEACGPSADQPTATIDPNRFYAVNDSCSLILPEGWVTGNFREYPAIFDPQHVSTVYFWEVKGSSTFEAYAGNLKDHIIQQFTVNKQIQGKLLATEKGQDYYRSGIEYTSGGDRIQQIFYIYSSNGWTMIITYSRPADLVADYDALVDSAMKTLRYDHK